MTDTESKVSAAAHDKKPRKRMKSLYGQIKDQMEFYYSDSNLNRDRFMKKQIDDTEDGYLSLDMFLKFNKIKNLTSDTSVIATALKHSNLLQVNEDGTKVKRSKPLSCPKDIDERTVYVECLPQNVDHEWIKRVFSGCGNVLYVSIPRYKSTGDPKGFAFIEFDTANSAKKACEELNNPPAEAGDKPGKFPRTSKQLTHLQKTLSHKEIAANESDKSLTESPIKSGKKKKRRRQTSECSAEGGDNTKHRKLDFDEKDPNNELSKKEETSTEKSNSKTEDNCDKEAKKKNKKRKRPRGEGHLTESETSDQLSESESLKRKKSELDDSGPPTKSSKLETVSDDKENNVENKTLVDKGSQKEEIIDKTGGKKKKRSHKTRHKEKDIPELRVISKKEWLDLKAEYLKLQKENMNKLKKTLTKLREKDDEIQMKEEESVGTKKERPKIEFIPDCIVQITSGRLMYRREIKDDLEDNYDIAYIDVKETAQSGYIRMKDSDSAKRLAQATCGHYFFSLLQGQEEKDYWEKLEADRNSKLNTKGTKKKQKGSTKLIEKAQKIGRDNVCRSHIKFDDD